MNNEPVAWRYKLVEFSKDYWHLSDNLDDIKNSTLARIEKPIIEPLYTHPAKSQADIEYELDKEYWRTKKVTDKEMIVFLMDEIDAASRWLEDGQTHMALGVLGQCHAEIRKHLSK